MLRRRSSRSWSRPCRMEPPRLSSTAAGTDPTTRCRTSSTWRAASTTTSSCWPTATCGSGRDYLRRHRRRAAAARAPARVTCLYHGIADRRRVVAALGPRHRHAFLAERRRRRQPRPRPAVLRLDHRAAARRRWPRSAGSRPSPTCSPTITRSGTRCAPRGEAVAIPPFAVGHLCSERSFARAVAARAALGAHHPRVDPVGYAGSVADPRVAAWRCSALLLGGGTAALALAAAALACRGWSCACRSSGRSACRRSRIGSLPLRDLLSFAVFSRSYLGARRDAGGVSDYRVTSEGTLMPERRRAASS